MVVMIPGGGVVSRGDDEEVSFKTDQLILLNISEPMMIHW